MTATAEPREIRQVELDLTSEGIHGALEVPNSSPVRLGATISVICKKYASLWVNLMPKTNILIRIQFVASVWFSRSSIRLFVRVNSSGCTPQTSGSGLLLASPTLG